jgi:LPPG:FO 2-phospho-L-lactate transferase
VATHLVRTRLLGQGRPLSEVTEVLCRRWQPGVTLLPATDDVLETHAIAEVDGETLALHFQEWWIRYRANLPTKRFVMVGAESAKAPAAVLAALEEADIVLVAPSNPVVSIGPILAVADLRAAVAGGRAPVVGVSPIIGGAPVRGMADRCLEVAGAECSAAGVGGLLGARSAGGILDGWLVDDVDKEATVPGVQVRHRPLWMTDEAATAAIVREALALGGIE